MTSTLINTDRKSPEKNVHMYGSIVDQNEIQNSSSIFGSKDKFDTVLKSNNLYLKQMKSEDKMHHTQSNLKVDNLLVNDKKQIEQFQTFLIYTNSLDEFKDQLKFFRAFIERFCLNTHNWKSLANSIYRTEHLINNLDNYQIKEFIQNKFHALLDSFILFVKDLISIQIKSKRHEQQQEQLRDRVTKENQSKYDTEL